MLVETIESRYRELWAELTDVEEFDTGEMHRIESRVRRLNALGFDVAELDITTDFAGLDDPDPAQGRGRRAPSAAADPAHRAGYRGEPGAAAAQRLWTTIGPAPTSRGRTRRSWRTVADRAVRADRAVGADGAAAKLEPAELYHEVLEHRWFLSEAAGAEVSIEEAASTT